MRKILAIDDIESNLLLIKNILPKHISNCSVITALNGKDGISMARKEKPDVILLDIMMPEMDGFEACSILKADPETGNIPVICISAIFNDPESVIKGLDMGADAYLSKPIDNLELAAQVRAVLRVKEAEDKLREEIRKNRLMKEQLQTLNSYLTQTEERERKKIAEALHDGLGQILALAFMRLSSLTDLPLEKKVLRRIKETKASIQEAVRQTKTHTYNLSPPILYELGLIPALRWKLEEIEQIHHIKTSFDTNDMQTDFNSDINILLYRSVAELLNNIIKHARAQRISVVLEKKDIYLHIKVIDNGIGFNTGNIENESGQPGFGLFSIAERLNSVQGELLINSTKEKGTEATIIAPLTNTYLNENQSSDR